MKRVGNLFENVVSFGNLYQAAKCAMRGCGRTKETCRFFFHLEPKLLKLQREMREGSYRPGTYRFFWVYDPKKRRIAVAPFRDRVIHHAVVGVLTPIYENRFIFDSYATRPEKGTHKAISRAQHFIRRWSWFLKADVDKYFDNVDHTTLLEIIRRKIKDPQILDLLERIVRNAPTPGRGLPIGNLTSQFLANVYLDPFDHFVKETLHVKGYLRYMDDFVLFADTSAEAKQHREEVRQFISKNLKLGFNNKSVWINKAEHGLSFLGMRIFPGIIRLRGTNRRRTLSRMNRKIEMWHDERITEEKMQQSLFSSVEHLRKYGWTKVV